MPRNKWTPKQVQDWANQSSNNNSNGGSGGGSGNTIGNPAVGARIDSGPIGTYGFHKGVNLKATDPDWKEHFHEIMDMFGNIPVVGSLFSAINAGVYIAEGNAAGAAGALANVVLDFIPGGGEAASSVKVASDMGKLAEESGVKLGEQEIEKGAEQVVEKQAEKQGEKQSEKQGETETDKENDKENEKQNGGNAIQRKKAGVQEQQRRGPPGQSCHRRQVPERRRRSGFRASRRVSSALAAQLFLGSCEQRLAWARLVVAVFAMPQAGGSRGPTGRCAGV